MSNFNIFLMTLLVSLAVIALCIINFTSYFPSWSTPSLSTGSISGSAVEHKRILFTLNYDQQNNVIDYLNQSVVAKNQETQPQDSTMDVKRIIFYMLNNQPNIEVFPINYDPEGNMLFSIGGKIRKDTSKGKLKNLLSDTYDN